MPTTSYYFPTQAQTAGTAVDSWATPTNALTTNSSYSVCNRKIHNYIGVGYRYDSTEQLGVWNFTGIALPAGCTITNIEVRIIGRAGRSTPGVTCYFNDGGYGTGGITPVGQPNTLGTSTTTIVQSWSGTYLSSIASNWYSINSYFFINLFCTDLYPTSNYINYDVSIDSVSVRFTYTCPSTITVTTTTLPDAVQGTAYSQTLASSVTGATWSITTGALPTGLTLNTSTGVISGTPTVRGQYSFTVRALSACDLIYDDQDIVLTVNCDSTYYIGDETITNFESGVAYSVTLAAYPAAGGSAWALTTGTLPTGISFSTSTGAITGTPSAPGSTSLTFTRTWTNGCIVTATIPVNYLNSKTGSDLCTTVTETDTKVVATTPYIEGYNNIAYVMNIKTGAWTKLPTFPFSSALYKSDDAHLLGTRQDTGNVARMNYGDLFGSTAIAATIQTGYMDFGDQDEIKKMEPEFSEALKRVRAIFSDVKSDGNLTLTIYTEENTTGKSFTITPGTTDDVVYNRVRTALSRDIRGKYISIKIENQSGEDFWLGEMALKILPRGLK